jgi:hypothetical protein
VSNSINLLGIDVGGQGFNVAVEAMDALTGGLANELGRVNVQSEQVAASICGL